LRGRGLIIFRGPDLSHYAHTVAYEDGKIYDPYHPGDPETLDTVTARWAGADPTTTRWTHGTSWFIQTIIPQPFTFDETPLPDQSDKEAKETQKFCRYCGTSLTPNLYCSKCRKFISREPVGG
jgi:hypothetical protein